MRLPGNIPVTIQPFFLLLALGIGWLSTQDLTKALVWGVVIFISILWHEMGHAYTALAFGQRSNIELMGLGGLTKRRGGRLALWKEFLITLNGPLFGFMLAFIANFVFKKWSSAPPLVHYGLTVAYFINVFWTILNLMPVVPLDGGRLMTIIFEGVFGLRGVKTALFLSIIFGALISCFAFYEGQLYIGAFFILFVFESYREWNAALSITPQDKDMGTQLLLKEAQQALSSGQISEGMDKLQQIRDKAQKGQLYVTSTVQLAQLLTAHGRTQEAYEMLVSLKSKLPPDQWSLLQSLAYDNKNWKEAIQNGTKAYQMRPSYDVALLNALACAQLNDAKPTVGWLQRAISDGLPDPGTVLLRSEFDGVRNNELFKKLL